MSNTLKEEYKKVLLNLFMEQMELDEINQNPNFQSHEFYTPHSRFNGEFTFDEAKTKSYLYDTTFFQEIPSNNDVDNNDYSSCPTVKSNEKARIIGLWLNLNIEDCSKENKKPYFVSELRIGFNVKETRYSYPRSYEYNLLFNIRKNLKDSSIQNTIQNINNSALTIINVKDNTSPKTPAENVKNAKIVINATRNVLNILRDTNNNLLNARTITIHQRPYSPFKYRNPQPRIVDFNCYEETYSNDFKPQMFKDYLDSFI